MPLTVLVAADIHFGRSSAKVPAGVPAESARSGHAWEALVEAARRNRADLLLLAGDLLDAANRRWEAMGPLLRGIQRLRDSGTRTFAVAGNHDWETLPRLARLAGEQGLDGEAFRLLGAGGRWEREIVEGGGERLGIEGWSFPSDQFRQDPLASRPPASSHAEPSLGLLHGDLGSSASPYAPLQRSTLAAAGLDGWAIGHLHGPSLERLGRGFILSPGSPQALDFGEPGRHGAWLLTVDGGRVGEPSFVPLSTMRYEQVIVDLDRTMDLAEAESRCLAALRETEHRCVRESGTALRGLVLRAVLVGRSSAHAEAEALRRDLLQWEGAEGLKVAVDAVESRLLPPIDLQALARGPAASPLTVVARLLNSMESLPEQGASAGPGSEAGLLVPEEMSTLLRAVERRLQDLDRQTEYAMLDGTRGLVDGEAADSQPGSDSMPQAKPALDWALRRVLAALLQQEVA